MKDYFSKEAVGSAVVLTLLLIIVIIVRDNLPKSSFRFMA